MDKLTKAMAKALDIALSDAEDQVLSMLNDLRSLIEDGEYNERFCEEYGLDVSYLSGMLELI